MNELERQTSKMRIDTRRRALHPSWRIIPWREGLDLAGLTCHAVTEFPTSNGPADYGFFVDGLFLGIIEAKKVSVDPQNVLEQAKRYAEGATQGPGNWNGYKVPFLYATKGELVWHLDVRPDKRVSRPVRGFHTGPALATMFALNSKPCDDWLLDTPPDIITIYEPDRGERYDVLLTNPPSGTKGANQAPDRDDFTIETSNKQLNFVQHILTTLKPGGRAALVLPDKLTPSLLARAFRGQLVPQDPTDEPAEKLLERIGCQRESPGKTL